jgi:hypothetical protein
VAHHDNRPQLEDVFPGAGRAGFDDSTLVLLDAHGTELGRLTRA